MAHCSELLVLMLLGYGCTVECPQLFNAGVERLGTTIRIPGRTRDDKFDDILSVRAKRHNHEIGLIVKEGAPDLPHPFIRRNCPSNPSFEVSVDLPIDVDRVVFGRKREVIWQRQTKI